MVKVSYKDVKLKGKDDVPCEYVEKRKYANVMRPPCRKACRDCSYQSKNLQKGCREYAVNRSEEDTLGLPGQGWNPKTRRWEECTIPQDIE